MSNDATSKDPEDYSRFAPHGDTDTPSVPPPAPYPAAHNPHSMNSPDTSADPSKTTHAPFSPVSQRSTPSPSQQRFASAPGHQQSTQAPGHTPAWLAIPTRSAETAAQEAERLAKAPLPHTENWPEPRPPWVITARAIGSVVCLLLAVVLAGAATLVVGSFGVLTNSDKFAEVASATLNDPEGQDLAGEEIIAALWKQIDKDTVIKGIADYLQTDPRAQGLPPGLIADPQAYSSMSSRQQTKAIEQGIDNWLPIYLRGVILSPDARVVWQDANRASHTVLLDALRGSKPIADPHFRAGTLYLDLSDLVKVWNENPTGVPAIDKEVEKLNLVVPYLSDGEVTELSQFYSTLSVLSAVLPIMTVVFLVAGLWLAPANRHLYFVGAAVGGIVRWAASALVGQVPQNLAEGSGSGTLGDVVQQQLGHHMRMSVESGMKLGLVYAAVFLVIAALWFVGARWRARRRVH
ncbi:hypothetical protein [Timonella senegalensis]|uniref:hypothetical protein n=1 Tax=Timonella senegalensis TaxID=1465825 RepID=UPI002FE02889